MLQAANTDLFNPLVHKAHNSGCQNLQFLLQIMPVRASWSYSLRIFIFCTLGTNGLRLYAGSKHSFERCCCYAWPAARALSALADGQFWKGGGGTASSWEIPRHTCNDKWSLPCGRGEEPSTHSPSCYTFLGNWFDHEPLEFFFVVVSKDPLCRSEHTRTHTHTRRHTHRHTHIHTHTQTHPPPPRTGKVSCSPFWGISCIVWILTD